MKENILNILYKKQVPFKNNKPKNENLYSTKSMRSKAFFAQVISKLNKIDD